MKRGVSLTTLVLMAVLIGGLYLVSIRVNPPPPGPPKPPAPAPSLSATRENVQKMRAQMQAKMHEMQEEQKRRPVVSKGKGGYKPPPNPYSIVTTDAYWHQGQMGVNGIQKEQQLVAKWKQELKDHPAPPPTPPSMPIPSSGGPAAIPAKVR